MDQVTFKCVRLKPKPYMLGSEVKTKLSKPTNQPTKRKKPQRKPKPPNKTNQSTNQNITYPFWFMFDL